MFLWTQNSEVSDGFPLCNDRLNFAEASEGKGQEYYLNLAPPNLNAIQAFNFNKEGKALLASLIDQISSKTDYSLSMLEMRELSAEYILYMLHQNEERMKISERVVDLFVGKF